MSGATADVRDRKTPGSAAARQRLQTALCRAQTALTEVVAAAADYEAQQRPQRREQWPLDSGALMAWVVRRVAVTSASSDRLALHLRYFGGQRFLEQRPDGLLKGLPWPEQHRPA
jgi:hypothetical protein